ncbi:LysM peptidoglycan-binding domain-containing protein [Desulfovibrio litoralis]|uniref:Membrane-bound lytic murein transglycosylase D n=1 Tax=Desulfovibrio litoralis DSM 11393 TaxID=1121455 RepID=A0A1M7S646_9BACT|nr:LysM peptidoglycan-binding domain-containing protein [Desulfovibrio litoralis]SHN53946.1 membrane-bound lytic murein transglycosylase D [Desulfovibrio litoralis DSM 11393]
MLKKIFGLSCKNTCKYICLFCVLFSLAACSTKKSKEDLLDLERKAGYNNVDDIVFVPDLPDDDETPLSAIDKQVLGTGSELGQPISDEDWKDVVLHYKYFTRKKRDSFDRFIERGELWLPHIRKIFKDNNVPEEIAYLAIVESGFNPTAVSRVGATGVWQFMPYTGTKYGLTQNAWIDERRDTYKATKAAAAYLTKLYGDFGNWFLAIAAYNAGEGKISRALEGTGGADNFFDLSRKNYMLQGKTQLKDETKQYVPRFIAVSKIMKNLDLLGFKKPNPNAALKTETIEVKGGTDLVGLAKSMGMRWEDFAFLNPAFRRQISHPRELNTVYILSEGKDKALAFLERQESRAFAGWKDYTVKKGESVASLSKKFSVPVLMLKKVNPNLSDRPKAGTIVMVPSSKAALRETLDVTPAFEASSKSKKDKTRTIAEINTKGRFYTVSSGDTLYSLSRAWGTTPDLVRKANKMRDDELIRIGQRLVIPGDVELPDNYEVPPVTRKKTLKSEQESSSKTKKIETVKKQDKQEPAVKENKKKDKQTTNANSELKTNNTTKNKSYTIVKGDTLYSLARKNKTTTDAILKLNNFKSANDIKIGRNIKIPQ